MYTWNGKAIYEQWKYLTAVPSLMQGGVLNSDYLGPKTKKLEDLSREFAERFGVKCLQSHKGGNPIPAPCYFGTLDPPKIYDRPMPRWDASLGKFTGPFNTVEVKGTSYFDGKQCKITAGFMLGTCNNMTHPERSRKRSCDCKDGLIKYKVFSENTSDPNHFCEAWFVVMNAALQNWFTSFRTQETLKVALRCGMTEETQKKRVAAFEGYMNSKRSDWRSKVGSKDERKKIRWYVNDVKKGRMAGVRL